MNRNDTRPVMPWWRVGTMWLVVLGPAVVVLASFVLMALAVRGADTPLKTGLATTSASTMTPAHQARNHAATPTR